MAKASPAGVFERGLAEGQESSSAQGTSNLGGVPGHVSMTNFIAAVQEERGVLTQ